MLLCPELCLEICKWLLRSNLDLGGSRGFSVLPNT
ncbi:hypothetical protein E1A91_A13G155400v1 [Gossypium mustelinum]|uniref:Uncharacterized protein n=1 Tax=Gossypium mustelinum TaxID=34275 RepID=A0A5D2WIQ9_GOSMU|nr:hypothetical protein E1A91_A13G155400v1 [Gossypium mustelinum]